MPVVRHIRVYSSSLSDDSLSTSFRSKATTPEPEELGFEQDILNRYLAYYVRRAQYAQIGRDYDTINPPAIFPSPLPANEVFLHHKPQYADQWPIGFHRPGEWAHIWNGRPYEIDRHIRYGIDNTGDEVPWTHETEFKGASYRLAVDHRQTSANLPILTHGMIISFRNWNTETHKYIIDHCVYRDELNAYLKIVCYDNMQYAYDNRFTRPPLILAVPLAHSNAREHPNLISKLTPTRTISILGFIQKFTHSTRRKESRGRGLAFLKCLAPPKRPLRFRINVCGTASRSVRFGNEVRV